MPFRLLPLFLATIWPWAVATGQAQDGSTDRPNILLLFTDDQCFDTIAALGHPEVITPNLDRLARRGVAFTNAYNMGGWNGAICVASRTMMNTGRFIWRAYPLDNQEDLQRLAESRQFLSQNLSDVGYETFVSGKWHVKVDAEKIFDHVRHIRPGMPKDTPSSYSRPNDSGDWQPWDKSLGGFWEGGKHWSEVLGDDGVDYLKMAAQDPRPFFMYLAFNAPHDPRQSPREFVEMYDRDKLLVPANFLPENPYMDAMGADKSLRDEKLAPWPRTKEAVQLHRQEYFAIITHLDEQVGRILYALEETGQADNTYIVMTADHGLACGQHGLLGKQSMYEHSMKAPLIVVGPDIPQDRRIDTPVYVQDFVATALELAGVEKPEHVEFRSLLPLIHGQRDQQYEMIYGAYQPAKQRMVRHGNMKLIYYPAIDQYLMFDVVADPQEINDLADNPEYADAKVKLQADLQRLMKSMDDPLLEHEEQPAKNKPKKKQAKGKSAGISSEPTSSSVVDDSKLWKKHTIYQGAGCMTAIAANFAGDSNLDVICNADGKTRLFVAPDWQEVILDDSPGHNFIHSEAFDVDGDGDLDYVGARYNPGLIVWLEQPANPLEERWTLRLVDDQIHGIHGLLRGDVDRDGQVDLLATSAQPRPPFADSLAWYGIPENVQSAERWQRHIFAQGDAPGLSHYLGFGDVNGDGRPDAASGAKGGPQDSSGKGEWFAWWEAPEDPTRVWKKHMLSDKQPGATNIHPADVNGDGQVDFLASRGHGKGVVWFEAPDWKEHAVHSDIQEPHCLAALDMDGDGDIDAATCAYGSKLVAWFENDGHGNFQTHIVGHDQEAYDIRVVDMDGDLDLDLLIAGRASNNVVWYEHLGK